MKLGFTGSQGGMDEGQIDRVRDLIGQATELHHGDCIGSDAQAHVIAMTLGVRTVIHPPDDGRKRAFCQADEAREPRPYLVRNRNIVDATDALIAAPDGPERRRSGTWATIRYARKIGKPVTIIG